MVHFCCKKTHANLHFDFSSPRLSSLCSGKLNIFQTMPQCEISTLNRQKETVGTSDFAGCIQHTLLWYQTYYYTVHTSFLTIKMCISPFLYRFFKHQRKSHRWAFNIRFNEILLECNYFQWPDNLITLTLQPRKKVLHFLHFKLRNGQWKF